MAYYEDIVYDDNMIKCSLCSVYLNDDNDEIKNHIKNTDHRDKEMTRILIRNSVTIKDHNFYCCVCNKLMDVYKLSEHIQTLHHENGLEQVKDMIKKDGIFLRLPEDISDLNPSITCLLCNYPMPYDPRTVKSHIESDKHRRARAIAIQPLNGIFSLSNSDKLWCKFCNVYFDNYMEIIFEHVDYDEDHKTNMVKILNLIKDQNITLDKYLMNPQIHTAYCQKCDKDVPCNLGNVTTHCRGALHNK